MNEAVKRIQEYDIDSPDFLDLSNLNLKKVPHIPYGVAKLDISYNDIKELENLPDSLYSLNCSHNRLDYKGMKSIALLDKLQSLNCSNNHISKLPELPKHLAYLNISNNQFSKKPDVLSGVPGDIVLVDYNNKYNPNHSECIDLDFYFIASKDNVLVKINKEYICYRRQELHIFLEDYNIDEEGWNYLKSRYYSIYNIVEIGKGQYSVIPYRSSDYIEI
jgi:Leucine-rich repeat (LRR) protein